MKLLLKTLLALLFTSATFTVSAENYTCQTGSLGFQEPATDLMADVINFHTYILLAYYYCYLRILVSGPSYCIFILDLTASEIL